MNSRPLKFDNDKGRVLTIQKQAQIVASPKGTNGAPASKNCVPPGFNTGPGPREKHDVKNRSQLLLLERSKKKLTRILQEDPSRNSHEMT